MAHFNSGKWYKLLRGALATSWSIEVCLPAAILGTTFQAFVERSMEETQQEFFPSRERRSRKTYYWKKTLEEPSRDIASFA